MSESAVSSLQALICCRAQGDIGPASFKCNTVQLVCCRMLRRLLQSAVTQNGDTVSTDVPSSPSRVAHTSTTSLFIIYMAIGFSVTFACILIIMTAYHWIRWGPKQPIVPALAALAAAPTGRASDLHPSLFEPFALADAHFYLAQHLAALAGGTQAGLAIQSMSPSSCLW